MTDLHVVASNFVYNLYHTIRHPNGTWDTLGDVEAQAGNLAVIGDVDTAALGGELHVFAVDGAGTLFHAIRHGNGTWAPFTPVPTGSVGAVFRVSASAVGGELHVCVTTPANGLFHAIRGTNGTWSSFGNVEQETGDVGDALDVDVSAVGQELHVLATSRPAPGQPFGLFHTIRRANGTWTAFGDVEKEAGEIGEIQVVTGAAVGDELHVCVLHSTGGPYGLSHTIRRADGTWTGFGDVEKEAGEIGEVFRTAAVGVGDELHLCAMKQSAGSATFDLVHTIRHANGTWQAFGDVETAAAKDIGDALEVAAAAL